MIRARPCNSLRCEGARERPLSPQQDGDEHGLHEVVHQEHDAAIPHRTPKARSDQIQRMDERQNTESKQESICCDGSHNGVEGAEDPALRRHGVIVHRIPVLITRNKQDAISALLSLSSEAGPLHGCLSHLRRAELEDSHHAVANLHPQTSSSSYACQKRPPESTRPAESGNRKGTNTTRMQTPSRTVLKLER